MINYDYDIRTIKLNGRCCKSTECNSFPNGTWIYLLTVKRQVTISMLLRRGVDCLRNSRPLCCPT